MSTGVDVRRYRAWLERRGLTDRPWLVLGAAPSPTLPPAALSARARVDINNSGRTARELGLGRADLTFRSKKKSWAEHSYLDTDALVWIHTLPSWAARLDLLRRPHVHVGSLRTLTRVDREALVIEQSGASLEEVGELGKVTNGVAALCFGLALGVPRIALAGVSLTAAGHSYDELGRSRRQVDEDTVVLRALARRPEVETTEPELAEMTGIRLVTS